MFPWKIIVKFSARRPKALGSEHNPGVIQIATMPDADQRKAQKPVDDTCNWTLQFRRVPPRIGDDFQVSVLPQAAGAGVYDAACLANAATDADVLPTVMTPYVGHKCVPIWSPRGQHFSETEDFISLVRASRCIWPVCSAPRSWLCILALWTFYI